MTEYRVPRIVGRLYAACLMRIAGVRAHTPRIDGRLYAACVSRCVHVHAAYSWPTIRGVCMHLFANARRV